MSQYDDLVSQLRQEGQVQDDCRCPDGPLMRDAANTIRVLEAANATLREQLTEQEGERCPYAKRADEQWHYLRKSLQDFARMMESKLRENDYKDHWSGEDISDLTMNLESELCELKEALEHDQPSVVYEAADVANYAMMIADNSARQAEGEGGDVVDPAIWPRVEAKLAKLQISDTVDPDDVEPIV